MMFFRLKGKTPPTEAQYRKKKETEIVVIKKKKKKGSVFPAVNLVEEQLSVLSQNNYRLWYNYMV